MMRKMQKKKKSTANKTCIPQAKSCRGWYRCSRVVVEAVGVDGICGQDSKSHVMPRGSSRADDQTCRTRQSEAPIAGRGVDVAQQLG